MIKEVGGGALRKEVVARLHPPLMTAPVPETKVIGACRRRVTHVNVLTCTAAASATRSLKIYFLTQRLNCFELAVAQTMLFPGILLWNT